MLSTESLQGLLNWLHVGLSWFCWVIQEVLICDLFDRAPVGSPWTVHFKGNDELWAVMYISMLGYVSCVLYCRFT